MFKHFISLLVALQLFAGVAFADKTLFVDGNAATRSPGTRVTAAFLNAVNNHRHDGKSVDGSGVLDYAVDTGSANAIVIALAPPLTAHVEGMPVYVKVAANNTGPTTLAINGLSPVEIVHRDGASLVAGELLASQIVGVAYNGSHYQLTLYEPIPNTNALTLAGQTAAQLSPPGAISMFAMPSVPAGWLACDGRAVLRISYPALYAAIGTTWGAGDGVSTFNLPDFRGEFLRGWDNGKGTDPGRLFGTWQADDFKSHTHGSQYSNLTPASVDTIGAGSEIGARGTDWTYPTTATGGAETRPRNVALPVCIKY